MIKITAYTDGSAITTGEKLGGIGVYIKYNNKEIFLSKGYRNTTISRMEMRAVLFTIQKIPTYLECKLLVYSDSQFICNSFNKGWLEGWERDNFLGRKNADLWKQIVEELGYRYKTKFEITHLHGHQKDLGNEHVYGNNVADICADYKVHKRYNEDNKEKLYYYYHAESDSLWSSYNDFEQEGNLDGCTESISQEMAMKLAKKLDCEVNELGDIEINLPF